LSVLHGSLHLQKLVILSEAKDLLSGALRKKQVLRCAQDDNPTLSGDPK
jgi:hypothetical protein